MDFPTTFSPPAKDHSAGQPTFQLRMRAACSIIKRHLLGEHHKPFEPQHTAMEKALRPYAVNDKSEIQKETWLRWWRGETKMQPGKLAQLDRASGKPEGFIQELVLGGTRGQSFSPLHAHFDALDSAGYFGRKDEDWVSRRREMALFVLNELQQKWRPDQNRYVPGIFPKSLLRVQYDALATDEERAAFAKRIAGGFGYLFNSKINHPDALSQSTFNAYDSLSPVGMLAFLLAVGYDDAFMSEEKIDAWALDLATASLALSGLVFADDYDLMHSNGKYNWLEQNLHILFWIMADENENSSVSEYGLLLYLLMAAKISTETDTHIETFNRGRKSYAQHLKELGLTTSDVKSVIDKASSIRPLFQPETE